MTNYYNYLYTNQLDLNLDDMHNTNVYMHNLILNEFYSENEDTHTYPWASTKTTKVYGSYNLFLYPFTEYYKLYKSIRDMFYEVAKPTEPYYLQAWLNVYETGEYLDWHTHAEGKDPDTHWHGFYCADVETERSYTLYEIPPAEGIIKIDSVDNLLVMGKCGDLHKTSEWSSDSPRVSIAFNIIPLSGFDFYDSDERPILNHFIPLL
jgi:hypothetical protein